MEWSLEDLLGLLLRKSGAIFLAAVLGAIGTVLGTWLAVTPQYASSVTLYVIETQSGRDLADSFSVIVTMRESLMEVIRHTGLDTNHTRLQKQITVSALKNTDFLEVTVSSPDPEEAVVLANAIGTLLPRQAAEIMEGTSVKLVGEAIRAREPYWPSYPSSAFLGAVLGALAVVGWVLMGEFLRTMRTRQPE